MAIEYLGLSSLNGPLAVLEGVSGAAYDEIVEMTVNGKEKKLGRIIEVYEDKAVIQVFESTENMALRNTHTPVSYTHLKRDDFSGQKASLPVHFPAA